MNRPGYLLLELCVYFGLALFVLLCASTFVLHTVRFNRHLEQNVTAECALHNACMLFLRDAAYMPRLKKEFLVLQPDKISYVDRVGNAVVWYFEQQRFMRSYSTKIGTEHASALAPAAGKFLWHEVSGRVQQMALELSHNQKSKKIKAW